MSEHVKKMIVFDLDGTLAESKQPLDSDMATLLSKIVDKGYLIAIMSGGSLDQFKAQFLASLTFSNEQYKKLFLLPTSGASLYAYENEEWRERYTETLSANDRQTIPAVLHAIVTELGLLPEHPYGALIEDRITQITYSGLGQQAPVAEKQPWDPDQKKRLQIAGLFSEKLPQFAVHIGGMTSIDITRKGIDKAFGVEKLSIFLSIPITEMTFVGDALFPGGNDDPVRTSGIDCISVTTVQDTKHYLEGLLN